VRRDVRQSHRAAPGRQNERMSNSEPGSVMNKTFWLMTVCFLVGSVLGSADAPWWAGGIFGAFSGGTCQPLQAWLSQRTIHDHLEKT
jgi:hypothetical protein